MERLSRAVAALGCLLAPQAAWAVDGDAIVAAARTAPAAGSASLPGNSEIWLSLDRAIDSRVLREGATFPLSVSRDVMLGDHVVIPRGTPARGQITYRTGKGGFGKSAKLEFDLVDVDVAGHSVPIAGHYRIRGEGNTGATVGAVVAAGLIAGALVTGRSAVAEQGTEYRAFTRSAVPVLLTPASGAIAPQIVIAATARGPAPVPRRKTDEDVIEVAM